MFVLCCIIQDEKHPNTQHMQAQCSMPVSAAPWVYKKQNLMQFGLGDATDASAVWIQTPSSVIAERRDIKKDKNST